MPKGKKGPVPEERKRKKPNGHTDALNMILQCKQCSFNTAHLPEMTEHLSGSGHTEYDTVKPTEHQKELYSEPAPILRKLPVPYSVDEKNALNATAGLIAIQIVEQREIATLAKERGRALEADQNAVVAKLKQNSKTADVQCVWKVNLEENSKTLVRLDTNEVIETRPISQEDREQELARVAAANATPPATAAAEGATA